MSYEITIKEIKTITVIAGKEWTKVGEKEVERERTFYQADKDEPKTRIEAVYGYTPEIEKQQSRERVVLNQTVDELDIAAVIKAINKL